MDPKPKSLASKLAEIMGEVERIAKRGRNDFHKYDYATESDITAAIREHLASRQIIILPRVKKWSTLEKSGEKGGILAFVDMSFSLVDGETGETFECDWLGCGEDKGDKAIYKGFTGALKYFLLKLFLIPTGDDPEREGKKPKRERSADGPPPDDPPDGPHEPQPVSSDAAAILTVAAELSQILGAVDPGTLIREYSSFRGNDGKEKSFSDPTKVSSQKWLKSTREKLERELHKHGALAAVQNDEIPF